MGIKTESINLNATSVWAIVSLAVALIGTVGSLYLSIGMGLKACPLCFYQRSFVMATLAVLAIGLSVDRSKSGLICLLCLPLAVTGLGVAAYHEYLVVAGHLECPQGLFGLGTSPIQSMALFIALAISIGLGARWTIPAVAGSIALGLALAWGCLASAPPMPPAPVKPYDQPPEICRPPYRPTSAIGE